MGILFNTFYKPNREKYINNFFQHNIFSRSRKIRPLTLENKQFLKSLGFTVLEQY